MNRQEKRTKLMLQVKKLDKEKNLLETQMEAFQQEKIERDKEIDEEIEELEEEKEEISEELRNADCRFQQCEKQIDKLLLQIEECVDD